jgi:hypothetical protein
MVTQLEDELMVVKSITCPYDKFFEKKKDKEKEKGKGKGRDKAKLGDEPKKREPQATVNPTIPSLCSATIKKIKAAHPHIHNHNHRVFSTDWHPPQGLVGQLTGRLLELYTVWNMQGRLPLHPLHSPDPRWKTEGCKLPINTGTEGVGR